MEELNNLPRSPVHFNVEAYFDIVARQCEDSGECGDTAGNSELRRRKTDGTVGERGGRQPEAGAFETGDSRHAGIGIQRRKMLEELH